MSFGKAEEFSDERKSNKQELSGLSRFPDVLPVSSCDDRRLLIAENMNVYCNGFPYRIITLLSHCKYTNFPYDYFIHFR